jgi:hypothetical protein
MATIEGGRVTLLTRKGDLEAKLKQAKRWQRGFLAR